MSNDYNVDEILADPARTRRVVQAAVDAMWRVDNKIGPGEFLKMGSEEYAAVSILRHGLIDMDDLISKVQQSHSVQTMTAKDH